MAVLDLCCCRGFSLAVVSKGFSLLVVHRLTEVASAWAQYLQHPGLIVAAPGL